MANAAVLTGALALDVAPGFRALAWPPVMLLTVGGALGAVAAYWVLSRVSETPDRHFTLLAAVLLVVSFVPDLVLLSADPAATVAGVVVLMVMHVTVAAACVGALTRRTGASVPADSTDGPSVGADDERP